MANLLDSSWFEAVSGDKFTRETVKLVAEQQKRLLANLPTELPDGDLALSLNGLRITVEGIAAIASLEVFEEVFHRDNHFLDERFIPRGKEAIVDLGANLGFYALHVKQRAPECRLLCVEPNPGVYRLLKENLANNGFGDVMCEERAVGLTPGRVMFDFLPDVPSISGSGLRSVPRKWLDSRRVRSCEVQVITLQEIDERFGESRIDILKIDVEGAEMEILGVGSSLYDKTAKVVVERHSVGDRDRIMAMMKAKGFELSLEEDASLSCYYADMYFVRS